MSGDPLRNTRTLSRIIVPRGVREVKLGYTIRKALYNTEGLELDLWGNGEPLKAWVKTLKLSFTTIRMIRIIDPVAN